MKPAHFLIIFITILSSFVLLITLSTDINVNISEEDEEIRTVLYDGAEDAVVKALEERNYLNNTDRLWTQKSIKAAIDSLNDHFENRLEYDINSIADTTDYLFPIACFLDTDGYCIRFIGTENDGSAFEKKVITELNTWTYITENGNKNYNIQYYLGENRLTVTDADGMTVTGTYDEIDKIFNNPFFFDAYRRTEKVNGETKTFIDADSFNENKMVYIITKTQEMLNYYLNNKTTGLAKLGKHIELNFDINNDALHQAFENKGLIIFMEGPNFNNFYDRTLIYGYAHYELTTDSSCIITFYQNEMYYHKDECYEKDNQEFYRYVDNAKKAALLGANPCVFCY